MEHLLYYKNKIPKYIVLITGAIISLFFGLTDYLTGSEMSFSIFYLIPISLVTLLSGITNGLIISFISASIWLYADLLPGHIYSHNLIPYWNAFVRLGYFSIHSFLLCKLLEVISESKALSLKDSLTGIPNYRFFEEFSHRELQKTRRSKKPLTIAYIDLDNFKNVNDTMGHSAGDDLLKTIAEIIQADIRSCDIAARVGGDEFTVLLTETDFERAENILRRLHKNIENEMNNNGWEVTLSIGAVTYKIIPSDIDTLIKQADKLMYTVKKEGKNNIKHIEWPINNTHDQH